MTNAQSVPFPFYINNFYAFFRKCWAVIVCGDCYRKWRWLHFCEIMQIQSGFMGIHCFGDLGLQQIHFISPCSGRKVDTMCRFLKSRSFYVIVKGFFGNASSDNISCFQNAIIFYKQYFNLILLQKNHQLSYGYYNKKTV